MSYLQFNKTQSSPLHTARGTSAVRSAFARWLLANYGANYRSTVKEQRRSAAALRASQGPAGYRLAAAPDQPQVGIVGGGFAGMFAGLILQSLGIEFELFEASDRVGGRIHTWYSTDYDPKDKNRAGLYGELGGMRLPQFSEDMLPVQQHAPRAAVGTGGEHGT